MTLTNRQSLDLLIKNLEEVEWLLFVIKYNSNNTKNDGPWKYYWPRLDKAMKTIEFMWRNIK